MSTSFWRRPLALAAASVAIVTVTACGAQKATHTTPSAPTGYSALAHQSPPCGFSLHDLPDKPKSELTLVDRARIMLAVLTGQVKKDEVAKKYKVSDKEITKWEHQVLNGDWLGLLGDVSPFSS
ncbi:DUF1153 domain-containing protein [Streptomyces sp. NPDC001709]